MAGLASPVPASPGPDTSVAGFIYRETALFSAKSASIPGLGPALYGMAGLATFLLLIALLRLAEMLLRRFRKTPPPANPPCIPIQPSIEGTVIPFLAEQSPAALRWTDPVHAPVPEPPNPNSAQNKALQAAALMAIGSRCLRSPEVSGTNRRSSDYQGPRRRSTDSRADPVYNGPYRRVSDRSAETIPETVPETIPDPTRAS